jgi:hypothetical protein
LSTQKPIHEEDGADSEDEYELGWCERKSKGVKLACSRYLEKNQHRSCSEYFTISPESAYYKIFGLIVTLSCLTSPYFYAYIAAFRMSSHSSGTIMNIYYVYESLFLLNMVSQFFLEYQNENTK